MLVLQSRDLTFTKWGSTIMFRDLEITNGIARHKPSLSSAFTSSGMSRGATAALSGSQSRR